MEREEVTSSNLRSVGYDAESQILEIEFKQGAVYQYYEVPPEVHASLMAARSIGRAFRDEVQDIYQYDRVS